MADQDFTVASSFTISNDALTPYIQNLSSQLAALDTKISATKAALNGLGSGAATSGIKSTTSALQAQINTLTGVSASSRSAYESAQVFALALGNTRTAATAAAPAINQAATAVRGLHASAGPAREGIVLLHEAISGRFSRIPGSLLVMGEYFGGIGPAALASVVGVGALAFAVYEFARNAIEARDAILGVEGAAAQLGQVPTGQHRNGAKEIEQGVHDLASAYGISTIEAAKWSQAVRSNMKISSEEGVQEIIKLSAVVAQANNQWDKLPEIAADLAKKTQSAEGLKTISADLHIGVDGLISEADRGADGVVSAFQRMIPAVEKQIAVMSKATEAKHQSTSWENIFTALAPTDPNDIAGADYKATAIKKLTTTPTPNPAELIPPPPVPRDQPDPEIQLKDQIEKAQELIKDAQGNRTQTEAQTAKAVADIWRNIKIPSGVPNKDEYAARVLNERKLTANAQTEAEARARIQEITSSAAAKKASGTLSPTGAASVDVSEKQAILNTPGISADQRIQAQQELATAQAQLSGAATAQQLHDLQTLVDKTREGSAERVAADQKVADFAASHYAHGSSQIEEATRALETAQRELARKQAEDADVRLSGQAKNISDNAAIDLDKIKTKPQKGILADPSELASEQEKIIASSAIAVSAIEKQREALFSDDLNKQDEIENARVHGVEEALAKITELERAAAQQTEQEWAKVNKDIGDGLSRSIMDGLEGKKGGFGAGIQKWLDSQLQQALSSGLSSTASAAEGALGIDKDKQSPGGLVASGADALGLGGVAKFFGIGSGQGKDQALVTSNQQLIQALSALTAKMGNQGVNLGAQQGPTASGATLDVATNQNTQALNQVSAASEDVASITGQHSIATKGLQVVTELNTIAMIPNTIATIANTIATIIDAAITAVKPFAAGGDPPVGVPSLVGEKGPELFVPKGSGTIIPNDKTKSLLGSQAVNDNALSAAYQNSGGSVGTKFQAGDATGAARDTINNAGDTTHATVNQTNNFSTQHPQSLEKQLAEHVRTSGKSSTRAIATRAFKR